MSHTRDSTTGEDTVKDRQMKSFSFPLHGPAVSQQCLSLEKLSQKSVVTPILQEFRAEQKGRENTSESKLGSWKHLARNTFLNI